MFSEEKRNEVNVLLREIEKCSLEGEKKDVTKAMDKFNDYIERLPEKEREHVYIESMSEFRKIMKKVDERKKLLGEMMTDATKKNIANQGYSKY